MKSKKGLSLLVLTITIMVMILLASIVVFTAANTTNNSKKAAFASDLEQIEGLVKEYYLSNGNLPIVTGGTEYTKTTFTNLINDGKSSLEDEISENGDNSAVFYKLDLSKLEIEATKRGLEEDGDATDAYFLASGTFNVYYLKGEEIANEYYFSLSEKLTGKSKVANNHTLDTSNITISSTTGAIKLTKSTAEFTNALTVDVKVTLEAGETMKYTIAGKEISVEDEATTIDVADIVSNNSDLKVAFYQNEANKYLLAQKYSSGNVIAEVKINISNLDILSGDTTIVNLYYNKYDKYVLGKISGYTDLGGSGVKEARVLYLVKKEADGTISSYYNNLPSTVTKEYIKNSGKSANPTTIKLPADVDVFALVFIDNAGNVSEMETYTVYMYQENLGNVEQALANGLKVGDVITGYTPTVLSTTTSGKENTASNAENSGSFGVTQTDTPQTVKRIEFTTWRYIGRGESGEIMIAPDMISTEPTDEQKMSLSGKGGYLYGVAELDAVCKKLYSTTKGTARSMNVDDVRSILMYSGENGAYYDEGNNIRTSEAKTIAILEKQLGKAMYYKSTPDGSDISTYKSDGYLIAQGKNQTTIDKTRINIVFGGRSYWLASKCSTAHFSDTPSANFNMRNIWGGLGSYEIIYQSGDVSYKKTSAIRPVVLLNSTVKLIKQTDGIWKIS